MNRQTIARAIGVVLAFLVALTMLSSAFGQPAKAKKSKSKKQCVKTFDKCLDPGCGSPSEADLNERKNIRTANLAGAESIDLNDLLKMDKPADYIVGESREPLKQAGEGKVVTTVAWLTDIRKGSPESCNCYFTEPNNTDNHMVLLNDTIINKFAPKDWEKHSLTAEFTPRVRQNGHPNFTREKIRPLILKDPRKRLWVRLTGSLMFDGYHEVHPLQKGRETNWEIHPVFRFEYCPPSKKCTLDSNANWKNIEQ